MYERIVAGTDLSNTAKVATDRAASLAKALSAPLILVHAGSDPGESLGELGDSYGAEIEVVKGNPVDALIDATESSSGSLLVVGSVGMSGTRRFMLGNVPNKVSHSATTDLLIVKTDPPPKQVDIYSRIMVGTDGSETAMSAVDRAADLTSALGAQLLIVCAYDPPSDAELERMAASAGSISAQWDAAKHNVDAEVRTVKGSAPEVLISIAKEEDFDLVVVGSVGMTGAKRFKLGNVPHRISHHAPTDLLILRTA